MESMDGLEGSPGRELSLVAKGDLEPPGSLIDPPGAESEEAAITIETNAESSSHGPSGDGVANLLGRFDGQERIGVEEEKDFRTSGGGSAVHLRATARGALDDGRAEATG